MESRFLISNKSQELATIDIDGYIGADYEASSNTKEGFKARLKEVADLQTRKIIVNIDSLGGSLFDAFSIHDILATHPAEVEVNIYGMTASAATVIAMAGNRIRMSDNALLLVHRSSMLAMGNKNDLEMAIDDLTKFDDKIAGIYSKRTGKTKEYHLRQMDKNNGAGEWLTPEDARRMGYVDEVFEPAEKRVAASVTDLTNYNLPIPENLKEGETMGEIKEMIENLKTFISDLFRKEPEVTDHKSEFEAKVSEIESKYQDFQAVITEKDAEIEQLKAANGAVQADKERLETELEAMKALPVDVKTTDPDIGEAKKESNPFDEAANEMKKQMF